MANTTAWAKNRRPALFRPQWRDYSTAVSMVARTKGDPKTVLTAMQREMRNLDPTLPLYGLKTLKDHMKIPLFPAKIAAGALGSFGVLALVLAAVGIYGVMSYVVAGRTREIGLRMALGARTGNVRGLILRQGMTLAVIGSVIGLGIAFGATRLLKSVLYGVDATDPTTFIGVTLLLGGGRNARVLDPRAAREPGRSDGGVACGVGDEGGAGGSSAPSLDGRWARRRLPNIERRSARSTYLSTGATSAPRASPDARPRRDTLPAIPLTNSPADYYKLRSGFCQRSCQ